MVVDSATTIRQARHRAGLSLRELADIAGTSHSTLAAYEAGRVIPKVDTLARIVRAAGFAADLDLAPRVDRGPGGIAKSRELEQALELAASFPSRPTRRLRAPVFGRS